MIGDPSVDIALLRRRLKRLIAAENTVVLVENELDTTVSANW